MAIPQIPCTPAFREITAPDQPTDDSERQPEIESDAPLDRREERQYQNSIPAHAHDGIGDEALEIHVRGDGHGE